MKRENLLNLFFGLSLLTLLLTGCQPKQIVVENELVYIEFNQNFQGIQSFTDKISGKDYSSINDSIIYNIRFGNDYTKPVVINSAMSDKQVVKAIENGIEIQFVHSNPIPFTAICTIVAADKTSSAINWSIKIINESDKVVSSIEYPVISCKIDPVKTRKTEGVLYPFLEGVVLTGMDQPNTSYKKYYPGQLSAQLLYYFNQSGGLYYAAHDGQAYRKSLSVSNQSNSMVLSQEYYLPIEMQKNITMPYQVVTAFSGSRWEDGADIYREWTKNQEWCKTKLADRKDVADYLKEPNLFINYSYITPAFSTVEKADRIIKNYHDFFKMPIIATGFGWEKNEIWIGPDYFPPIHGVEYYQALSKKLKERGDHLHVFTSGFRWAIKKPIYHTDGTMTFTKYDGTKDFMEKGTPMATIDYKGETMLDKREWAHNYFLCVGSKASQDMMSEIFAELGEMGIAGIDIDQNLGGEVDNCFSPEHGHQIGAGRWQYEVMKEFMDRVRSEGKIISEDMFSGVEEPCEAFIPQFDAFHGRAYTDTQWPVMGPGGVSVPLFIFLYHPYQFGYSGWIDDGFSALGNVKYGMGRSFIFGMYPGVRTTDSYNQTTGIYAKEGGLGRFDLTSGIISDELKTVKSYTELMKKFPEFLVHGEMISEIDIIGSDTISYVAPKRIPLPVAWPEVQCIGWNSASGNESAYAVANLSEKVYSELKIKPLQEKGNKLELVTYDYDTDQMIVVSLTPEADGTIKFGLKPWQLGIIRQYK